MTSSDSRHDRHVEALLAAARGGVVPRIAPDGTPEEQAQLEARLRQAHALVALRRRSAPAVLEGFVVAALHAGAREQRAISRVRDFTARDAPAVLAERVAASIDQLRAPGALDTYVAERLALPGAGLAQSFLGRLPRLAAPEDLAARLAAPGASGTAGLEFVAPRGRGLLGRVRPQGSTQKFALVVTAALLLFGLAGLLGGDGDAALSDWKRPAPLEAPSQRVLARLEPVRPRVAVTFEFVAYDSLLAAPLTPELLALVSGLVGEALEGGS